MAGIVAEKMRVIRKYRRTFARIASSERGGGACYQAMFWHYSVLALPFLQEHCK